MLSTSKIQNFYHIINLFFRLFSGVSRLSLNYDKFFTEGDVKSVTIEEFNSNNTRRLNLSETVDKIASLEYIQNELSGRENISK